MAELAHFGAGHRIIQCTCGKIIAQCRCPGPHRIVVIGPCTHKVEK